MLCSAAEEPQFVAVLPPNVRARTMDLLKRPAPLEFKDARITVEVGYFDIRDDTPTLLQSLSA